MPRVATFIFSENIQRDKMPQGEDKLHIIGPLLSLKPSVIPSMFSFVFTIGIINVDVLKEHTMQFLFQGPNGDVIADSGVADLPVHGNSPEAEGIFASVDFRNVLLQIEGEYFIDVLLDGEKLSTSPITVRKGGVK